MDSLQVIARICKDQKGFYATFESVNGELPAEFNKKTAVYVDVADLRFHLRTKYKFSIQKKILKIVDGKKYFSGSYENNEMKTVDGTTKVSINQNAHLPIKTLGNNIKPIIIPKKKKLTMATTEVTQETKTAMRKSSPEIVKANLAPAKSLKEIAEEQKAADEVKKNKEAAEAKAAKEKEDLAAMGVVANARETVILSGRVYNPVSLSGITVSDSNEGILLHLNQEVRGKFICFNINSLKKALKAAESFYNKQ